jgi:hypothetical protein
MNSIASRTRSKNIQLACGFAALFALAATAAPTPEKPAVAQLAFLAGTWRGTASTGRTVEELISAPEGGVMLSAGREFKEGRCVFFDLVAFVEKDGAVQLIPHPNGRRSPRTFPLVQLDATAHRAVFENPEHDFPKKFTYEIVAPDRLRITLAGDMRGKPATEVFDLLRTR